MRVRGSTINYRLREGDGIINGLVAAAMDEQLRGLGAEKLQRALKFAIEDCMQFTEAQLRQYTDRVEIKNKTDELSKMSIQEVTRVLDSLNERSLLDEMGLRNIHEALLLIKAELGLGPYEVLYDVIHGKINSKLEKNSTDIQALIPNPIYPAKVRKVKCGDTEICVDPRTMPDVIQQASKIEAFPDDIDLAVKEVLDSLYDKQTLKDHTNEWIEKAKNDIRSSIINNLGMYGKPYESNGTIKRTYEVTWAQYLKDLAPKIYCCNGQARQRGAFCMNPKQCLQMMRMGQQNLTVYSGAKDPDAEEAGAEEVGTEGSIITDGNNRTFSVNWLVQNYERTPMEMEDGMIRPLSTFEVKRCLQNTVDVSVVDGDLTTILQESEATKHVRPSYVHTQVWYFQILSFIRGMGANTEDFLMLDPNEQIPFQVRWPKHPNRCAVDVLEEATQYLKASKDPHGSKVVCLEFMDEKVVSTKDVWAYLSAWWKNASLSQNKFEEPIVKIEWARYYLCQMVLNLISAPGQSFNCLGKDKALMEELLKEAKIDDVSYHIRVAVSIMELLESPKFSSKDKAVCVPVVVYVLTQAHPKRFTDVGEVVMWGMALLNWLRPTKSKDEPSRWINWVQYKATLDSSGLHTPETECLEHTAAEFAIYIQQHPPKRRAADNESMEGPSSSKPKL